MLKVLSLFAGIGGFDLGLERTGGFKTVAFCEIDPHAQAVLRKHWPEVPIYDDVTTLSGERLSADGIAVDVIVGGFPCQDISTAGAGAGIEGERSGLWADYARLIGELRPSFVIVENVSALLSRGLGRVLGDLAALGYDADWHCIPASALGAPHRRDRLWIIAYPACDRRTECGARDAGLNDNPASEKQLRVELGGDGASHGARPLAHPPSIRLSGQRQPFQPKHSAPTSDGEAVESFHGGFAGFWSVEPKVGRVADGIPGRVDRLKQLGNAVVPQVVELIGRAILASIEKERAAA